MISAVVAHVKQQLSRPEMGAIKHVFLVGGFGACILLQDQLKETLRGNRRETRDRWKARAVEHGKAYMHVTSKTCKPAITSTCTSILGRYETKFPQDTQIAVIKGAVISGHTLQNKVITMVRKAKMTYGVASDTTFVPGRHDPRRRKMVLSTRPKTAIVQTSPTSTGYVSILVIIHM